MRWQLLNILFLGIHDNGKGSFFPEGVVGAINTPVGYNLTDTGLTSFPFTALVDGQVRTICCCYLYCNEVRLWPQTRWISSLRTLHPRLWAMLAHEV